MIKNKELTNMFAEIICKAVCYSKCEISVQTHTLVKKPGMLRYTLKHRSRAGGIDIR